MKIKAVLPIVLILTMTITFSISRADPQKPKLYVDPQNNTFSTATTPVGTNFTISIKTSDWPSPGLFSYQLELYYNNTMLQGVNAVIPPDQFFTPANPNNIFFVDRGTINQTLGKVSFAVTLLGDEAGKVGSGTISNITFKITQAPSVGNLSCTLALQNVILVDANVNPVTADQYDIINGNYVYVGAAPPPVQKPSVYVDPKDNTFSTATAPVGTNFTISIKAANWTAPGVFSYEFKLYYNSTLLQGIDAELPADHWLKPTNPANISIIDPGTINQNSGFVSFNVTLLGNEQGKVGNGIISNITFNITQAPTSGSVSCPLEIKELVLKDPSGTPIPSDQYNVVNGNYLLSAAPPIGGADLNGDGQVNVEDIAIWGLAFGSTPTNARWNPIADMNSDGKIDMIDAVLICKHWTG